MARSIPALVTPELLKFGREEIGFSIADVAKKLNIKPEKLTEWESGQSNPTIVELKKIAKLYKRSEVFFYLPSLPEKVKKRVKDYRKINPESKNNYSTELYQLIESVSRRHLIAIELAEDLGFSPNQSFIRASIDQNPEEVAEQIRSALKVSLTKQMSFKEPSDALKFWIDAVEDLGIIVFRSTRSKVLVEEMRGFSIWDNLVPVIVLNAQDSDTAKIFTLMHELTHIALRISGICNFVEPWKEDSTEEQKVEVFCNHVAGAILVPAADLFNEPAIKFNSIGHPSDEDIKILSEKFSVSKEVILRRLLITEQITKSVYQEKREAFLNSILLPNKRFGRSKDAYSKEIINKNGKLYPRIVLQSFHEDRITLDDVSSYLGSKLRHLKKVEESVFS